MYKKYFGLRKAPFSIAPDPRYLYMSERHKEALAHLLYGIKNDAGFVLLTGEVGAGKTTICRRLIQQLPKSCDLAYVINPTLSSAELLAAICDEFGINYPKNSKSIKLFIDRINNYLLASHANRRRAILVIDEAQNLSNEVLEQVRLLTNLETNQRKLLQIILIGQPELREKLAGPDLRQISQRIVARYHLGPLSKAEVPAYVKHRLIIAGTSADLFSPRSLSRLHGFTGGIPRLINTICDRALLGVYARGKKIVDSKMIDQAASEILGRPFMGSVRLRRMTAMLAAGVAMLFAAAVLIYFMKPDLLLLMKPAAVDSQKQVVLRPLPTLPEKEAARQEKQIEEAKEVRNAGQADREESSGKREKIQRVEHSEKIIQTVEPPPPASADRGWRH